MYEISVWTSALCIKWFLWRLCILNWHRLTFCLNAQLNIPLRTQFSASPTLHHFQKIIKSLSSDWLAVVHSLLSARSKWWNGIKNYRTPSPWKKGIMRVDLNNFRQFGSIWFHLIKEMQERSRFNQIVNLILKKIEKL